MQVERILAPNPGPFTGPGTNTYVIGDDQGVIILDPGPVDDDHADAIVNAIGMRRIASVVVTHTHSDHAPLANPLARQLDVPTLGHAPGPEFDPDLRLEDGDVVEAGGVRLQVVHTPGHARDHLCFLAGTTLFTGDHIMGGSSVMIDDLSSYLASLRRLQELDLTRLHPGHGPDMDRPQEVISWYLAHRLQREQQIVQLLGRASGPISVGSIVEEIYADVDTSLHPMAALSVAAHLRKLHDEGKVTLTGETWVDDVRMIR